MTRTRLTVPALFGLLLLGLLIIPQPAATHPLDQAATPEATPHASNPIAFGKTITGTASRSGENQYFHFDMPAGQDVAVLFHSEKSYVLLYCVNSDCEHGGGGGDDLPTDSEFVIPATASGTIELDVLRLNDGAAPFSLTVYPIAPLLASFGAPVAVHPEAETPFQELSLEADVTKPFVVEVQDAASNGNYLWVTYQPDRYGTTSPTTDWQTFPGMVDVGSLQIKPLGISTLVLEYIGKTTFRVLVGTTGDFQFRASLLEPAPLVKDKPITVMLSDQQPVWVGSLDVKAGEALTLHTFLTSGTGLSRSVYQQGSSLDDQSLYGAYDTPQTDVPASITARQDGHITVVLTIPGAFTRGTVTAQLSWKDDP